MVELSKIKLPALHADATTQCSVLIVDDTPAKLMALGAIVSSMGLEIVTATSGELALRQLLKRDFAVILLDVRMPVMDGFETATLIRSRPRSEYTPIIFVTAEASSETEHFRGYTLGAVDVIYSPIIPEILRAKVQVFVNLFVLQRQVQIHNEQLESLVAQRTAALTSEREALRESENRFRMMFEHTADALLLLDGKTGQFIDCNQATVDMLRCTDRQEVLLLRPSQLSPLHQMDGRSSAEKAAEMIAIALHHGSHRFEWIHCSDHRQDFPVEVLLTPILLGEQQLIIVTWHDITERKQAAELLRASEEHLRTIIDATPDCVKIVSADNWLIEMNAAGLAMIEADSLHQVTHLPVSDLLLPEHREAFKALHKSVLQGNKGTLVFEIQGLKGTRRWMETNAVPMTMHTGETVMLAITRDITEKRASEAQIWKQANFDPLTGLPNRRMFHDRLEQEIKKSHRSGLPMALLLLDLDHFKEVNDTLGHAQGDVLLVETARRVTECVRETDTVARLGGDEFIVILSEMEDASNVGGIAQKIVERLAEPFQLLQETVFVSSSIGITLYPDDAQDVAALVRSADQAMYVAKNAGRNRFSYFTAALQEAAQTRLHLINDLRNALPFNQLAVHYQPIVELATGKIHKAEALLRWLHPERGMVSPAQFMPLAEESGLIHEIGDWVFHETTRELVRWRALFSPEFQVSVNVSPVQFRKDGADYASSWISHLRAMDLPGPSLVIEITEGLLLNAEKNVTEKLLAFRDAGVWVSLDDFGTGYSSLSYLKKFDIDYLKIDQSFVRNLVDDPDDQALCEAIIVMAHKLGLKVIAEGVETEQQRDLLAAYGCDYAQGWLYSKAVPAAQFEALLLAPNRPF